MKLVLMFLQDRLRPLVIAVDNVSDCLVDRMRRDIRYLFVLRHRTAEENFAVVLTISKRPELFAKPPLGNHVARYFGRPFDIVCGTGRDAFRAIHHFFGQPATEKGGDRALELLFRGAVPVLFRQIHRNAERPPARNDRHLINRIMLRHTEADDGMSGLVIGRVELLLFAHDQGTPLRSHHDFVLGLFELVHAYDALVRARGKQCCFINEVGKIRTGEPGRAPRDYTWAYIVVKRYLAHVYFQDQFPAPDIGQRHDDLSVKPPGSQ